MRLVLQYQDQSITRIEIIVDNNKKRSKIIINNEINKSKIQNMGQT
jgi:hypothetical protein